MPNGSDLAELANLRYVTDDEPGIGRHRRGTGFSYHHPDGSLIEDETLKDRIRSLAIPPAWQDVWISPDPAGHILATGRDDAGRKQYLYHPEWERVRDEAKFARLADFSDDLQQLRKQVDADLRTHGLSSRKVVALAVAVLDRTHVRVGNAAYAQSNGSYGLTTLRGDHIEVGHRHVQLAFDAKGGKEAQVAFADRRLARLIRQCLELSGQTLFSYPSPRGGTAEVTSSDVNEYLAETTGGPYTSKDIRTWGATVVVAEQLIHAEAEGDEEQCIVEAVDIAAEHLGNTRSVCRTSYVHPEVTEAFRDGRLLRSWEGSRRGRWANRVESAVRKVVTHRIGG